MILFSRHDGKRTLTVMISFDGLRGNDVSCWANSGYIMLLNQVISFPGITKIH